MGWPPEGVGAKKRPPIGHFALWGNPLPQCLWHWYYLASLATRAFALTLSPFDGRETPRSAASW